MLVSMTGYGSAENKNKSYTFNVDIKSVNNRFIDIVLRTNTLNLPYEDEIVTFVKKKCTRGRINININAIEHDENSNISLNVSKLNTYMNILNSIKDKTGLNDEISLNNVLNFSDLISKKEISNFHSKSKTIIMKTIKSAVDDLNAFRLKEGKNLSNDMKDIYNKVNKMIEKIETLSKKFTQKEVSHYKQKIKSIIPDPIKLDNDRIYQEIAIIMEKKDINEEIVRLKSHLKLFNTYLNSKDKIGKKMNFILQEMTREINTVGSKTDNVKISHIVIDVKDNLEKIKEQVQNIL
mgnify:CR=1 FL=1